MKKKELAGINVSKDILSREADALIEEYRKEFTKRTKGSITRAAAVVALLEQYKKTNLLK